MKIGIIADSIDEPKTGLGTYTHNLIKNLSRFRKHEYIIIHYKRGGIANSVPCDDSIVPIPKIPFGKEIRKMCILPFKIRELNLDVIHETYHFGPFLFPTDKISILTVFDLSPLIFPETHRYSTVLMHKLLFPLIIRNSDKILTISESTKQDLMKYLNISEKKIIVTYLSADEKFKPLNNKAINDIKQKYKLNFPFILYVGTLEPRKNIPVLLRAFYKLKKKNLQYKLIIAGKKGWKYKEIFEITNKLNLQKDVIFTGYVSDEDLPKLYNAADLFVYPSLYEGFGLPPLEAMACGTPVITSNTSSLPEVVGDAGIMTNPYNVDGLANAMHEVLTNDGLSEDMIKKGLKRAKMFSWEKTAKETLKVYEETYNEME